ncbi:MAG: peptidylprolyl isomerase [Rhodospirillaceae bacterium]|nr:peptidylprolyl isomerase [Rhodospirillaceae bacterium]
MNIKVLSVVAVLAASVAAVVTPVHAQQGAASQGGANAAGAGAMGIAAVVNEDIITVFDVQSRMAMFLATSGMENTPDLQRRILPQVIQGLIEERLKLQEAKRLKITTTEPEVRNAVEMIEAQNGMQPGSFRKLFTERNVDLGTLYSQIESDVAWVKVVRQELRRNVLVAPEEVKNVMERLKANQGRPEHLLSEIFLPVNATTSEGDIRQLADRLVQQARSGTPFAAIAQQFSQSPTAAVGGDLGWVMQGELEAELDRAVAGMEPNEISEPIRSTTGYHILSLRGRRASGAPDPMMSVVTLMQIYLPTLGGRAQNPAQLAQNSNTIMTQAASCQNMLDLGKRIGGPGSGGIEPIRVGGLPDKVRDAVASLPVNRVSPPIEVTGARLFVMVCQRIDDSGLPDENQIASKLENDKLENLARQKLRDLRRQALVDVRI